MVPRGRMGETVEGLFGVEKAPYSRWCDPTIDLIWTSPVVWIMENYHLMGVIDIVGSLNEAMTGLVNCFANPPDLGYECTEVGVCAPSFVD